MGRGRWFSSCAVGEDRMVVSGAVGGGGFLHVGGEAGGFRHKEGGGGGFRLCGEELLSRGVDGNLFEALIKHYNGKSLYLPLASSANPFHQKKLSKYSILFRLRLGLNNSAPALAGLDPAAAGQQAGVGPGAEAKAEKTVFEVKLEKFDAATKIKVIKEVKGFMELGLKEAKDLVEKAPIVVKSGVSKEEGEAIIEKLKALGATVVLE